jgi:transcriptional regulator with XRE-family HTH domain
MVEPRRPVRAMHTPRYRRFVKRLILARQRAGLTQKEAAAALGQRQPWVSKCEAGQRRVDVIELLDFARVYRVPLSFFLE